MTTWLITITISAIPLFFLWIFLHEGAHALTAKRLGLEIIEFKPYPHKKDGKFYFGRMRWKGEATHQERDIILIAPYRLDSSMFFLPTIIIFSTILLNLSFSIERVLWIISSISLLGPLFNSGNAIIAYWRKREGDLRRIFYFQKERIVVPITTAIYSLLFQIITLIYFLIRS